MTNFSVDFPHKVLVNSFNTYGDETGGLADSKFCILFTLCKERTETENGPFRFRTSATSYSGESKDVTVLN